MLENYFKTAIRNLWKHKTFSAIHILGLSMGIASALIIIVHIKEELSFDKGFSKSNRIFRITQGGLGEDTRTWAPVSPLMGVMLKKEIPEIASVVRFHRLYPNQILGYTNGDGKVKRFEEKNGFFADSSVVDVFDLEFISGQALSALNAINSIVITDEMSRKYFGKEEALGKTMYDEQHKVPLKVTGVVKTFTFNTHLHFDYLLSMPTISQYIDQRSMENRTWNAFYTYVALKSAGLRSQTEAKLPAFMVGFFGGNGESPEKILANRKLHLQPIGDIHLHSNLEKEMYANGNIRYVYILALAAIFILLVAAVNFINISTAQALNRMKEIGLRKALGAGRNQVMRQFIGEALLITAISTLIALLAFSFAIPFYNQITGKQFEIRGLLTPVNLSMVVSLILIIGILAGLYPAVFIADFNAIKSLKGKRDQGSSVTSVRKGLVVFQFAVSVFMIFGTIVIYRQLRLFNNSRLGFDKEQVVAVTMYENMWEKFDAIKNALNENTAIKSVSRASTIPGDRFAVQPFYQLSAGSTDAPGVRAMWADDKFLGALGITVKSGSNFYARDLGRSNNQFILNETAVKVLGLKDPIGKEFVLDVDTGQVVGIAKDFNFASLHSTIEPLAIEYQPFRANYLIVKVAPNQLPQTLSYISSSFGALSPGSVFTYTFLDEKLNLLYDAENRMSRLFKVFAMLALFISCLGLFGLAFYSAQLRVKEIGVRKVLGATVPDIVLMIARDFVLLMAIAALIAWPLAWLAMDSWLSGFAYHVDINVWTFVISGGLALLAGSLTVAIQAIKAGVVNPVNSLKSE